MKSGLSLCFRTVPTVSFALSVLVTIRESTLEKVDKAIDQVIACDMHVNVNFHRAPGYRINNPEREPFVLWSDKLAIAPAKGRSHRSEIAGSTHGLRYSGRVRY